MRKKNLNEDSVNFSDIEAHADSHFLEKWEDLCNEPAFKRVINVLTLKFTDLKKKIENVRSLDELHNNILHALMKYFIEKSIQNFTWSGLENIPQTQGSKGAIFISNHRSIILDPLLFNYILYEQKGHTAYTAFGDNLLSFSWFAQLMRLNRGFVVKRSFNTLDEKIKEVEKLSLYIKKLLGDSKSIWIAQRNGRAKDGNDFTDSVVPSMIKYSHPDMSWEEFTHTYPIMPISVSYEEVPLDVHQVRDSIHPHKKLKDRIAMTSELLKKKRSIHIHVSDRVYADKRAELVKELDKRIIGGLKIWNSNEVAYKAVTENNEEGMDMWLKGKLVFCRPKVRDLVLKLYAMPYINQLKMNDSKRIDS